MRNNILSILAGLAVSGMVVCPMCGSRRQESTQYPALLQVTSVQGLGHGQEPDWEAGFLVCLTNSHGFSYRYHAEDGDLEVGDFYACIMDDNGTEWIYDDTVVDLRYVRPDLFE